MNENEYPAVSRLKEWLQESEALLARKSFHVEFKDTGQGSACVDIDTDKYITRLTAWDHMACLNIEILEIESENGKYLAEGSNDTMEEFNTRLGLYTKWLMDLT